MTQVTNTLQQPNAFFENRVRRENFLIAVQLGFFKTPGQMTAYLNEHPLDELKALILKENKQCKL